MACEDDRPVAGLADEFVERGRHVTVSEIERLLRVLALQQECAERRLAVSRRPHLAGRSERARLALDEEAGAEFGVAAGIQRRIPAVTIEIGGRMDVEDRRAAVQGLASCRRAATATDRWEGPGARPS